jgi:MoxR-like ATPase
VIDQAGNTPANNGDAQQAIARTHEAYSLLTAELGKRIVGQQHILTQMMWALLCGGHVLLEGVPGLAKTLLIHTLADLMRLEFSRIQFTPDLMPADITGTDVITDNLKTGMKEFRFIKGPVFANIVLADEINRTPPKTQAALLQAMQEYEVTAQGKTHSIEKPFFVLATQNPIEQEGTYPLPEAQLDRFMMNVIIDYPTPEEEMEIVRRTTSPIETEIKPVFDRNDILSLQALVKQVPVAEDIVRYAVLLVNMSRPQGEYIPHSLKNYIQWGAGPRACQYLVLGSKARALLDGRYAVTLDDIDALAPLVLRHRVILNFQAEAEGVTINRVINTLIESARNFDLEKVS